MAGIKRQEVSIGEKAKGVVQEKNISRKGAKEAKVAEKRSPSRPSGGKKSIQSLHYTGSDH